MQIFEKELYNRIAKSDLLSAAEQFALLRAVAAG
jgi:hypothetical protein